MSAPPGAGQGAGLTLTLERGRTLGVDRGFRLPALPGTPLSPRRLTAVYFDTRDHRLARAGITLRHYRAGHWHEGHRSEGHRREGTAGRWRLTLPREDARLEVEAAGAAAHPPAALTRLVLAHTRGHPLGPVATTRTRRRGLRVRDAGGPLAEVAIDDVAVLAGRRVARRFAALAVDARRDDDEGLAALEARLRRAGARPGDGRPPVVQALGLARPSAPLPVDPAAPAGEQLRAMLARQLAALVAHDPGTRVGTDPEDLHHMRVATRRLRAFLRVARPLLDRRWAEPLRRELGWLGDALGPVRDLDVLLAGLAAETPTLGAADRRAFRSLHARLVQERQRARGALLEAIESPRYLGLLERMEAAARAPRLTGADASLPALAAREWRKLRRAAARLPATPSDATLHALRIRGKRARYAAELAEPAVGRRAARFLRTAAALQDLLGAHQDAVVTEATLRRLAQTTASRRTASGRTAFVAGRLAERQHQRAAAVRRGLDSTWAKLERRGAKAWE